ncbi:SH3 domain-containing protein [Chloroflexi bacterium TSY]|nr:SH3 domain-containing protein [Chloroflexi bacterium TSY]
MKFWFDFLLVERRLVFCPPIILSILLLSLLLTACEGPVGPFQGITNLTPSGPNRISRDLANVTIPDLDVRSTTNVTATVSTGGRRANVRSGPGLEYQVLTAASSGTTFDVVEKNDAGDWWQICCIEGDGNTDNAEEPSTLAWLADIVVTLEGDLETVPTYDSVFSEDLGATWDVEWQCGSERCEIQSCNATVEASVNNVVGQQWLQIDHAVTWDETCFSTDEWVFEVNRFSGIERKRQDEENFLYRYWIGPQSEEPNAIYHLDNGRQIAAYCSGPHTVEVEEGDGWSTIYEGEICHDIRTGLLLALSYEKRWLFTGEFEGTTYEREYFGDFEMLTQGLNDTSANVLYLDNN